MDSSVYTLQYVTVSIRTDTPMVFGGTEEPTAFGELFSIGAIGGEKNKQISKLVSDIVTSKFGVASDRFYLVVRLIQLASSYM